MKKTIILTPLILIILLIISSCSILSKPEVPGSQSKEQTGFIPSGDEVMDLIAEIKYNTKLNDLKIEDTKIKWLIPQDEQVLEHIIDGKGLGIKGVTIAEQELFERFYENKGFQPDIYNLSASLIAGMTGFRKNDIVCTVAGIVSGGTQGIEEKTSKIDLETRCGRLNQEQLAKYNITTSLIIQKLLAKKYNKKTSSIVINIDNETDMHARGTVTYQDEVAPGNSGMFLAARVKKIWQILYDGNGSFACKDMEQYNFPAEMLEGCF